MMRDETTQQSDLQINEVYNTTAKRCLPDNQAHENMTLYFLKEHAMRNADSARRYDIID